MFFGTSLKCTIPSGKKHDLRKKTILVIPDDTKSLAALFKHDLCRKTILVIPDGTKWLWMWVLACGFGPTAQNLAIPNKQCSEIRSRAKLHEFEWKRWIKSQDKHAVWWITSRHLLVCVFGQLIFWPADSCSFVSPSPELGFCTLQQSHKINNHRQHIVQFLLVE